MHQISKESSFIDTWQILFPFEMSQGKGDQSS